MRRLSFFILLLLPLSLCAQFTYVFDQNIPVTNIDGTTLAMPWAGGLNATQYNTMDLNRDGKDDLVLFDRMANKVITILNQNGNYQYAPEYESFFPAEINNWLLLRDFNCDGHKDIFTSDVLGIKVYKNTSEAGSNLQWEQFFFYSGSAFKSPVLLSQGFSGKINVNLQFDDLPAITDADGDGDLDIFNFRYFGGGTVEFHKNYSVENNWGCDSLSFIRETQNWGNFKECSCGVVALNGVDCPTSGGRTKHAGGKSLLAMDTDSDQDLDLIMSEAECTHLYELTNEGTLSDPVINEYASFPSARPVNILIYPAAYNEDVDFDGIKDLIFSPNIFTKTYFATNLEKSNQFYKNTGTATSPVFTYQQSDFLQEHMIEVGDNAVPAFADHDGDGDYDMFISRNGSANIRSTIYLYENTGTEEQPAFTLVNQDFLFFSFSEFYNLKIQFTDMDANNTIDLVFTATNFNTGGTSLYLLPNKSQDGFDFSNQSYVPIDFNLIYSENLFFTDVDSDSKIDILAGRANGALQYWKNVGEPSQFQFALENENFLGLGSSVLRQNISTAAADLDADGNIDLIYGDQSGKLKIISDYKKAADASLAFSEIVFNPLIDINAGQNPFTEQNLGGRIWPTVVNLFNTTRPAIVSGNILGGVNVLRHDEGESLPDDPLIQIFPNPVSAPLPVNIRIDRPAFVHVISVLGQKLSDPVKLQAHQTYQYAVPSLAPGLYLLMFTVKDKSYTKRLVITD
jgi:hypothetical protein